MAESPTSRAKKRALATVAGVSTAFALGCGGSAQQPRATTPEQIVPQTEGAPLLWRVEGESGPSYLFGTVHLGVSLEDVGPEITAALESADRFISEADMSKVDKLEFAALATLPQGKRLETLVGASTFTELVRQLSPELSRAQLDRLAPWLAYTQVLHEIYGDGPSLDAVLTTSAEAAGKKMIFLETWRFQLKLIAGLIGVEDLKEILDPRSGDRKTMASLVRVYSEGDFEALSKLIAGPEAVAKDPDEFRVLFEDRNRAWMPTLTEELRKGGAFVAIGAGHLAGDVGLLALLRQAGLEPTRVVPQ